jgi:hypothetical protein
MKDCSGKYRALVQSDAFDFKFGKIAVLVLVGIAGRVLSAARFGFCTDLRHSR